MATDWFNDVMEHRQFVQLGLAREAQARLAEAGAEELYYRSDGRQLGDRAEVGAVPADSPR